MKREFTNDDLEEFLKQSADSLRMKAPDKIWQNLSTELNKRRRRLIIGLSAFLLISSTIGYYTISNLPTTAGAVSNQNNPKQILTSQKSPDKVRSINTIPEPQANSSFSGKQVQVDVDLNNLVQINKKKLSAAGRVGAPLIKENDPVRNTEVGQSDFVGQDDFNSTVVDSYTEFDKKENITDKKEGQQAGIIENGNFPLTIESVVNTYKFKAKKAKLETQFYFVPTISYRKLTENKSYLRTVPQSNAASNYPAFHSSVNNSVTHKPDLGFELGVAFKYPVSSKLKLRTGFQFNVNRYSVKAFSSAFSVATIALNSRSGLDSLNTVSNYSNINGYKSNWLQNLSFQLSAPVGVELNLGSTDKIQFGIASSIQPTYVLGDRAYLITTDYKKYAQVPWLIRRWNVNTALETFVIYKAGKTRWQVGPQVRYQLLSSFISEYPVKENLFDFGFKIGISANRK